jgi:hypothetical protein
MSCESPAVSVSSLVLSFEFPIVCHVRTVERREGVVGWSGPADNLEFGFRHTPWVKVVCTADDSNQQWYILHGGEQGKVGVDGGSLSMTW